MNKITPSERVLRYMALAFMSIVFMYTVLRSVVISVSHDEALTYTYFVSHSFTDILTFGSTYFSNNHLLHSLLAKIAVSIFGASDLVVRLPALLGHALYLTASYLLSRMLMGRRWFIVGVVLLIGNPYLLDLFSVSRGYALGLGTLMLGLYYFFRTIESKRRTQYMVLSVVYVTLSVFSQLSFFIPYLSVIVMHLIITAHLLMRGSITAQIFIRRIAVMILSFITLGVLYIVPILTSVVAGEYVYGGESGFFQDTVASLVSATLYDQYGGRGAQLVFVVIGLVTFGSLIFVASGRSKQKESIVLLRIMLSLVAVSSLVPLAMWYGAGIKLPLGRTAAYLLPLFSLLVIVLWRVCRERYASYHALISTIATFVACVSAAHIILSAQFAYHYDWRYDSGTRDVMHYILQETVGTEPGDHPLTIGVDWHLEPSVNYYREQLGMSWLAPAVRDELDRNHDYYYLLMPGVVLDNMDSISENVSLMEKYGLKTLAVYPQSNSLLAQP